MIMVIAKLQQNTRKMATFLEACRCAPEAAPAKVQ
jgi:hypothetical protein